MRSYGEIKHLAEVINASVKKKLAENLTTIDGDPDEKRFCKLCQKPETKSECSYGPTAWERFSAPIKSMKK